MKIVRRLTRLLKKAGFAVEVVMPSTITDVGNADFWRDRVEAYAKLAPVAGILNEAETTAWREELLDASTHGELFDRTKTVPPIPHCFMTHIDPAFVKQILNIAQRQGNERTASPQADNLG